MFMSPDMVVHGCKLLYFTGLITIINVFIFRAIVKKAINDSLVVENDSDASLDELSSDEGKNF